jgi:hypothetical protein
MSQDKATVILKLYRESGFPRRIRAVYFGKKKLWERKDIYEKELDRRGLVTQLDKYSRRLDTLEIVRSANSKIRELREKKDYVVKNLSFLHFIECMISEGSHELLDLIKVEICLVLFHKYDMFRNVEDMMKRYRERGLSIFEPMPHNNVAIVWFLDNLHIYLYDVGKMLVSELKHDFFIRKELGKELELIPVDGFKEKYAYFSEIPFFYMRLE